MLTVCASAGVQSRSSGEIASAMLDAIAEFASKESPTSLQRVRIVILNSPQQMLDFRETLQSKVDEAKSGSSVYHWLAKVRLKYSSRLLVL